ncbi:MAG: AbrB/MazE/SpoVT family DNA-binding domain-containing protein [Sedimenticolaceae bacterium]
MATHEIKNEVQLGAQGRVVIPVHLRKSMDLKPGDRFVARQDGDSIVLERCENLVKRLQARFTNVPREISLVDELITERQAEAALEKAD